ncbi:MAG: four helix bundle protein [Chthoniobacterales bacterium]
MTANELKKRTFQLLRAGTSVGANYRAASPARSRADFIAKLGIVEEECDETLFWMEFLVALKLVKQGMVANLLAEGNELIAIVVSSINTARRGTRK